jgi:hypothetical protein
MAEPTTEVKKDVQRGEVKDTPFENLLNFRDVGKTINGFLGEKYDFHAGRSDSGADADPRFSGVLRKGRSSDLLDRVSLTMHHSDAPQSHILRRCNHVRQETPEGRLRHQNHHRSPNSVRSPTSFSPTILTTPEPSMQTKSKNDKGTSKSPPSSNPTPHSQNPLKSPG